MSDETDDFDCNGDAEMKGNYEATCKDFADEFERASIAQYKADEYRYALEAIIASPWLSSETLVDIAKQGIRAAEKAETNDERA